MAVLSNADRQAIAAQINQDISHARETTSALRADILTTVGALDDFLNTNATAVNNAIPAGPRALLTSAQKARILSAVIRQRYIAGA